MKYILRRLALLVPTLFGVAVVAFVLVRLVPGNVVTSLYALEGLTPAQRQSLEHTFGLDRPLAVQFIRWVADMARGNFGVSLVSDRPILPDILARLPATVELASISVLVATVIGMPLGVISAEHRGTTWDWMARQVALLSLAMPRFWIGLLLILVFAVHLRWAPSGGFVPLARHPFANLRDLVLPVITLSTLLAAVIMRMTRASMLDVLRHDYIRTALSKGVTYRVVLYKHALRNAVIPVLTVIGLQAGELLNGAIVVETIFSWPGIGSMTLFAIQSRDYPTVQAVILVNATLFAITNLVVDLAYTFVDPRVQYG